MKTTLVNHGGIIQPKFIVSNNEELLQYADFLQTSNVNSLITPDKKDSKLIDYLKIISENKKFSMLDSCIFATNDKILRMHHLLLQGHKIVVNMSGGYCYWNDDEMSLVNEKEIKKSLNGYENCIEYNIFQSKYLVLENASQIPNRVLKHVSSKGGYSYIKSILLDHNNELNDLIKLAIKNGCDTIVAESTLINKSLLLQLVELFDSLPSFNFELFLSSSLDKELTDLIGEERTNEIFRKHNFTIM